MSGQGPHQGLSYNRRFTITDCWEQREWNAPAHLFGEWRRDSTRSGEHECLCLCINISDLNRYAPQAQQQSTVSHTVGHLALIKQAQEDGPDAGTHEHWHMHPWCTSTCLATRTSLSPLPPSGWMMISSLLSADAKLWIIDEMSERPQQQSARMTDTYRERERHGRDSRLLSPLGSSLSPSLSHQISNNNNQLFFYLFAPTEHSSDFRKKTISLSMLSCLMASSDLTLGRPTLLFTFFFDLKTTHTMSVSIYE